MGISRENRVLVIGAGVGGLAAACDLTARGYQVTVLERHARVGGKMRTGASAAGPVDAGPTVLTMRWVFEEIFADAGACFERAVPSVQAQVLARHAWSPSERLDLHADEQLSARNIDAFAGRREAEGYRAYCAYARNIYQQVFAPFMRSARPRFSTLVKHYGPKLLRALHDIDAFRSMNAAQRKFFRDERLLQLFGRYATYAGGAPHLSPATLNVIAHVEQQGVWYVQGGMQRLAEALCALARSHGARVRCDAHVSHLIEEHGQIRGAVLDGGEAIAADAVVFNGEPEALVVVKAGHAPMHTHARTETGGARPVALSAITWTGAATAQGFALARHNVFFASDARHEFERIFKYASPSTQTPTVYLCAQDRADAPRDSSSSLPARPERFLCLINAPATSHPFTETELVAWQDMVDAHLAHCGLKLTWESPPTCTTPATFAHLFPRSRGALYGPPPHSWRSFFNRRGSRTPTKGLYLAGGSVHPGPGVPMAALSGRLAAAALAQDFPLITPCRTTATHGGTSTPKATTVATL